VCCEKREIECVHVQGWTKFSDFADLDALSEDEWDKVCTRLLPLYPARLRRVVQYADAC